MNKSPLVLIVDDNRLMRMQLRLAMEKEGYVVIEATNGEQCLEIYTQKLPDIILLDAIMPVMDGFNCCAKIQSVSQKRTPVLMITGLDDKESVDRAFEVGAADYITKPIHWAVLCQRVKRLIHQSHLYQQLEAANQTLEMRVASRTSELERTIRHLEVEIAERQRAEAALRTSEENFRQIAENIREVFFLESADSKETLYISPAYLEIWGRTCESVYQNPLSRIEVIHPEDQESVIKRRSQQLQTTAFDSEYRIIRPDGSIRWIWERSFPVLDQAGTIYRIAGIAEDITKLKRAEAEIHATLIKERVLNDLKSNFIKTVRHEFRSPLAVIALSVETLEKRYLHLNEEQRITRFQRIYENVQRITQVMEDALMITDLESGDFKFHPLPLNLHNFFHDIVADWQLRTSSKYMIQFECDEDSVIPHFRLDATLLHQILNHLIANAVRYSPQGSQILVELIYSQQMVVLKVSDRGIGIPQEDQDKLFDKFHRASNAEEIPGMPGAGLGLAIVKHAVDLHNGTITVESEVGKGTTFIVRIPFA